MKSRSCAYACSVIVVLPKLAGEAVHGPTAWTAAEGVLQARMLSDESRNPRPRWESKERFDEASADESASAKTLVTSRVAEGVEFRDQGCYFGRVKNLANVAYRRATPWGFGAGPTQAGLGAGCGSQPPTEA